MDSFGFEIFFLLFLRYWRTWESPEYTCTCKLQMSWIQEWPKSASLYSPDTCKWQAYLFCLVKQGKTVIDYNPDNIFWQLMRIQLIFHKEKYVINEVIAWHQIVPQKNYPTQECTTCTVLVHVHVNLKWIGIAWNTFELLRLECIKRIIGLHIQSNMGSQAWWKGTFCEESYKPFLMETLDRFYILYNVQIWSMFHSCVDDTGYCFWGSGAVAKPDGYIYDQAGHGSDGLGN